MIFKGNNVHFSAQETPGEKIPTDLQLEKAKLLCCFRQAKEWLHCLYSSLLLNQNDFQEK